MKTNQTFALALSMTAVIILTVWVARLEKRIKALETHYGIVVNGMEYTIFNLPTNAPPSAAH